MNSASFRQVALEHGDFLYGYASYLLGDSHEARDVSQEAFIRLWQNRKAVPDSRAAKAWLVRTAHRLCIDRSRSRAGRELVDPERFGSLPTDAEGPEGRAQRTERRCAVFDALSDLGPRDRGVLIMREVYGMAYSEMASLLHLSLGTLKAVLHRARARLRQRLSAVGVEEIP